MKDLRSIVVKVVIGSFALAALLGIIALLGGGSFGDTEGNVLLTTVIVGIESVAILSYLSVAGRRTAVLGLIGAVSSVVPFAIALWTTWSRDASGELWQTFGVGLTVAASIAQACLLLALVGRDRIGPGLMATLAAIAIVAAMIVNAILNGPDLGDGYWRAFGVVAILDVLGTVVLTALAAFGRKRPGAATDADADPVRLTAADEARIVDAARQRGVSPSELITTALDSFL